MPTTDTLTQLEKQYQQTLPPRKKRLDQNLVFRNFDDLCKTYPKAPSKERIDIQIFFAGKHILLEQLAVDLSGIIAKATQAAGRGKLAIAAPLLQHALTADAILDGRVHSPEVEAAHQNLLKLAEQTRFDLRAYAKTLEVPIADYMRRAQDLHQAYDRANATRVLGHILQLNPSLMENARVRTLAAAVTGQSADSAVEMLSSSFMCEQYVNELETGNKPRSKPQHFEPEAFPGKSLRKARKPKRIYSSSEVRTINIALTVIGLAAMLGATIGIALLINEVFPTERTSLSNLSRRSGMTILLMPTMGIILVLTGLVAIIRREINLGQFLNVGKDEDYEFSGPAALVMGISWTAIGVLLIGTGLTFLEGIDSFGFMTRFLSNPIRGVGLIVGMVFAMIIVGMIIRKVTPKTR
jgi:hypothetical protein